MMNNKRWLLSALMFVTTTYALAQATPSQERHSQEHSASATQTLDQKSQAGALLQIVRQSTERFKDVSVAEKEGYALAFGCVSGSDSGAMGLHFVNGALLDEVNKTGVLDADCDLRADVGRTAEADRRRLCGLCRLVECEAS
jgi:hypothetical protein